MPSTQGLGDGRVFYLAAGDSHDEFVGRTIGGVEHGVESVEGKQSGVFGS
jgi:hypothetical protein